MSCNVSYFMLLISSFITFWPKYVTYWVDYSSLLNSGMCESNVTKFGNVPGVIKKNYSLYSVM